MSVTTPNMNLIEPAVGNTLSPTWATNLNTDMSLIDSHDHSSGKGVLINPSGMFISLDLPFNSNNATSLRSSRYVAQGSTLSGAADLICAYAVGTAGDLYWNDNNGNKIQITASGNVAGSQGSISSLASPAAATWVSGTATFVWTSTAGVAANMDAGTLVVRYRGSYPSPSGNYIAIQAPAALASGYSITLPALPGAASFVQIDASGNLSNTIAVSHGITRANLAAVGQQVSSSSGTSTVSTNTYAAVTNLTVTITTTGRPVVVAIIGDGTNSPNLIEVNNASVAGDNTGWIKILRGSTNIFETHIGTANVQVNYGSYLPASVFYIDSISAGTYTYTVYFKTNSAANSVMTIENCVLFAYEL
jgi:hypothetical protein